MKTFCLPSAEKASTESVTNPPPKHQPKTTSQHPTPKMPPHQTTHFHRSPYPHNTFSSPSSAGTRSSPLPSSIHKFLSFLIESTGEILNPDSGFSVGETSENPEPISLEEQLRHKDVLLENIQEMAQHLKETFANRYTTRQRATHGTQRHQQQQKPNTDDNNTSPQDPSESILQLQLQNFQLQKEIQSLKHYIKSQQQQWKENCIDQEMMMKRKQKEVGFQMLQNHGSVYDNEDFIVPDFSDLNASSTKLLTASATGTALKDSIGTGRRKRHHRKHHSRTGGYSTSFRVKKPQQKQHLSQSCDYDKLQSLRERTSNADALFTGSLRVYDDRDNAVAAKTQLSPSETHTIKIKLPPAEMLPFVANGRDDKVTT